MANIEQLRKLRVGHICSFNGDTTKYKLIAIKPNDEFVFEQLTEREARIELQQLKNINLAISARWNRHLAKVN